jgi:hypothetical protein
MKFGENRFISKDIVKWKNKKFQEDKILVKLIIGHGYVGFKKGNRERTN